MEPTNFETEWYTHLINTALSHTEKVEDFTECYYIIDYVVDIDSDDTFCLDTLCVYFDLDIEYVSVEEDSLQVTLSRSKTWDPFRPDSISTEEETFEEVLADKFGGEPNEYRRKTSAWKDKYTEMMENTHQLYQDDEISADVYEYITGREPFTLEE